MRSGEWPGLVIHGLGMSCRAQTGTADTAHACPSGSEEGTAQQVRVAAIQAVQATAVHMYMGGPAVQAGAGCATAAGGAAATGGATIAAMVPSDCLLRLRLSHSRIYSRTPKAAACN